MGCRSLYWNFKTPAYLSPPWSVAGRAPEIASLLLPSFVLESQNVSANEPAKMVADQAPEMAPSTLASIKYESQNASVIYPAKVCCWPGARNSFISGASKL